MIYIKRFLYLLFMIALSIIGIVMVLIGMVTQPFVSMMEYIMHGELTKEYIITVLEWLGYISDKLKPE